MRRDAIQRVFGVGLAVAALAGGLAWVAGGCNGWDPREPFTRNAPEVDQSLHAFDAGKPESAAEALERYLGTGACVDGGIGLPDLVRQRPDGSYDLGLALFQLAERFGQRFGEEEATAEGSKDEHAAEQRSQQIDCALVMLRAIAADPKVAAELRARAYYLAGNLEFLRRGYEDAVKLYDQALTILPGVPEDASADGLGRDAAHNRAIALRRIDDQKDAGDDGGEPDAGDDGGDKPDAGSDGGDKPDAGDDAGDKPDAGDDAGDKPDAGDDGGTDDGGADAGDDGAAPAPEPSAEPPPAEPRQQDDRILDQLERAPTYQEQEAKERARRRRGRTMEDK